MFRFTCEWFDEFVSATRGEATGYLQRLLHSHESESAQSDQRVATKVALYMTHAYVEPHEKADPAMSGLVARTYIETGERLDALVIPVGLAFELAYRRRPDIQLHKTFDGTHPSLLGTYLSALVVYGSVYRQSVADIEYDYFGEVDGEDAAFLRSVADDTLQDFFAN